MSLSVRTRLAAGIVLAFVVTLAVIFVTVQFALGRILTEDLDDSLALSAKTVLAEASLIGSLDDPERIQQDVVDRYSVSSEGRTPFITAIRDVEGARVASTAGVTVEELALAPDELERVLSGETITRDVVLPGDRVYRVRSERLSVGGQVIGVAQVARDTKGVDEPVDSLLLILIPEGIAAMLASVAFAYWLSRGAVRPLQKVIDVAADIQASDLKRRINSRGQPAEVQKLADTFDAMLERLDRAFQEQQDFVMDVSHELRTPLTALKGNLDVMLMDQDLDDGARDQFERMSAEVSRLTRMTSNLLYLASAEAGREPEHRPVELDLLCFEVLRQARELRSVVKIGLGHEDQITVLGDRDQLKQMLLNLVENALKYTPPGGEVTLSLYSGGLFACIEVADTGAGIPDDILPHIFERFYRGAHRSKMGGTGLGLAISDRIARSHGGAIEVESSPGKGSRFIVKLPTTGGDQTEDKGIAPGARETTEKG